MFQKIEKSDLAIISYDDINNYDLISSLLCEHKYIYVLKNKLFGIISITDFEKKFKLKTHVVTSYTSLFENTDVLKQAKFIYNEKKITDFPIINLEGELLYVLRKKEHIINSFDFDWNLCDSDLIKDFLKGVKNVFYLSFSSSKIVNFIDKIKDFCNVKMVDTLPNLRKNDIAVISKTHPKKDPKIKNIDEIYLLILSQSAIKYFEKNKIQYFFFQSPVKEKLSKSAIFLDKPPQDCSLKELSQIYAKDKESLDYWLKGEYKFCTLDKTKDGLYLPNDAVSKTYNVSNNQRHTFYQPETYQNTIYVLGTCIARGYGVTDELTIPSFLQKKINTLKLSKKYIVRNFGTGGGLNSYCDIRDFVNILKTDLKQGDVII